MRLSSLALAVVLAGITLACVDTAAQPAEYHENFSFPAQPGKVVLLELRSVDSMIEVVDGDTIEVSVDLEARSSSRRAAHRWVEARTPEIEDSATHLKVRVPSTGGRIGVFGYFESHDEIRVSLPASCTLEVRNTSGDVTIDGRRALADIVRIDTTSGDVAIRGGVSQLVADTNSGDLRISGDFLALLEVETASGDVRLDDGAERVLIETSSGDLTLRDLTGELTVTTTSGDVQASWRSLDRVASVRLDTGSGDVVLRVPESGAPVGELRTGSGDIRCDFPGEMDRRGRRYRLAPAASRVELEEGSTTTVSLDVHTSSGDIVVNRRPG